MMTEWCLRTEDIVKFTSKIVLLKEKRFIETIRPTIILDPLFEFEI